MTRRTVQAIAAIAALALLIPTTAIASPGSSVFDVSTRGSGTIDGPLKVNLPGIVKFQAYGDLRVFDQELSIGAGGHTGWHTHPGPVLVTVKSGVFRYQDEDCSYRDYTAGQTVVDPGGGHVHIGRNVGTGDLELSITYLIPPDVAPRIDAAAVTC